MKTHFALNSPDDFDVRNAWKVHATEEAMDGVDANTGRMVLCRLTGSTVVPGRSTPTTSY